jgi:hypothetical protein
MDTTKILAAGLIILFVAGSVTAVDTDPETVLATDGTSNISNADVYATVENSTVTLRLVDGPDDDGIGNATVSLKQSYQDSDAGQTSIDDNEYERVGITATNGTVVFEIATQNMMTLEVTLTKGVFDAEIMYSVEGDSLSLVTEEYEYEQEEEMSPEADNTTQYNETEQMSINLSDAREIANATLDDPPQGDWALVEASTHSETNAYEFEYVLVNANRPGEAEIRIHSSSGEVIKYEQDIEQREREKSEQDDEGENENTEKEDAGEENEDTGEDENEDSETEDSRDENENTEEEDTGEENEDTGEDESNERDDN